MTLPERFLDLPLIYVRSLDPDSRFTSTALKMNRKEPLPTHLNPIYFLWNVTIFFLKN